MKVNWNMPPKKSGSSCFQTVDECWDYVANFAWKNTKMPKPVSAFKFAFPLCILSSLFAHLRWETPWLHQQEGCGWVVLLGHKSRCAIFFPKKKEKKQKLQLFLAWICSQFPTFPFPTMESLNLFQKNKLSGQHAARALCRVHCRWRVT